MGLLKKVSANAKEHYFVRTSFEKSDVHDTFVIEKKKKKKNFPCKST
jgi:hypothetical protein